jgi:EAL and modified HD-GYP domain-containing signal transduction protein
MNGAPSPTTEMTRVGRQPILGCQHQVVGYELLFRDRLAGRAAIFDDGDYATSSVIVNSLVEIGLERLVGDVPAFVNFTKSFLVGDLPIPFDTNQVVIEVLESVDVDAAVIQGLFQLSEKGYTIALDDFAYTRSWNPCLETADIVKLDVLAMDRQTLTEHVMLLRNFDCKLLAEKVEDYETYSFCTDLGFDMFQGYYFAKPSIIEQKRASASVNALLATLAAVNDPNASSEGVARAVASDPLLTHKMLRYVNSPTFGLRHQVDSIHQTIVYIGRDATKSLATLLLLTSIDNKPPVLIRTALIRAMACKKYAEERGVDNTDAYFTAGLKQAITSHAGPIGACLRSIIACERDFSAGDDSSRWAYVGAIASVETGEGLASLLPSTKQGLDLTEILGMPRVSPPRR